MSNAATDPQPNVLEQVIHPSKYENIDMAVLRYIDETLNIHVYTNKGWKKVPVAWKGAERAFQIKHNQELRDQSGTLKFPIITIERTGEEKGMTGAVTGYLPPDSEGGAYMVTRRVLQDKTGNFANTVAAKTTKSRQFSFRTRKQNNKVVYQTITTPAPVYVTCMYEIKLRAEYQQQINDMKTPFITRPGRINHIYVYDEHHRYEAFVDGDFGLEGNKDSSEAEPRYFESNISIRVLGYLIGEGNNQEGPKMVIRENAVEIKFPREHVIVGDVPEHLNENSFYREL